MRTSVLGACLVLVLVAIPCSAQSNGPADAGFEGADAQAFDELVLGSKRRSVTWVQAPELVVLTSEMQYQTGESNTYPATSQRLTEVEVNQLIDDLSTALAELTDGVFTTFASVRRESVEPGATTDVLRPGVIVVGRFRGVKHATHSIGFGGRKVNPNGTITSGAMMLDADYDRASDARRLLRTHELGHALGYNHVVSRSSIMNARIGADLTDFDRKAAMVAFRGSSVARRIDVSSAE
jgi:hypothetical protein